MATKDITLGARSEETGRFNFVRGSDGDVSFDETGAHEVMTSVIERKGTNPFDRTHGSRLYRLRSLTSRTPSQAEAEALDATSPSEAAEEIQQVEASAEADPRAGNRLQLTVSWKPGTGERQSVITEV